MNFNGRNIEYYFTPSKVNNCTVQWSDYIVNIRSDKYVSCQRLFFTLVAIYLQAFVNDIRMNLNGLNAGNVSII